MPVSERFLVLLRGVNVGGRNLVPMAELRALFTELGSTGVATYIQSGNLVCTAPPQLASLPLELAQTKISTALEARFGFPISVALRTFAELAATIRANPFAVSDGVPCTPPDEALGAVPSIATTSIEFLHVVFLAAPLAPSALQALQAKRTGEEQLAAQGRELFLLLPHGVGRSKLAFACTAPTLPGNPTMRNWKTVLQLHAMLAAPST